MTSPIYEWRSDYFCAGCIVFAICNEEPYLKWVEDGNTIENNGTALNLNLIREFLKSRGYDTKDMPRRLRRQPEGTPFCATCLNFFHNTTDQGTS